MRTMFLNDYNLIFIKTANPKTNKLQKGVLDGDYITFYEDSTVKMKKYYKNGVVDNDEFYYHENGQLSFEKHWDNGKQKGRWEYFYPNGQLKIAGSWKDGLKDGKWEYYMENGNKEVFVLYSKEESGWFLTLTDLVLQKTTMISKSLMICLKIKQIWKQVKRREVSVN